MKIHTPPTRSLDRLIHATRRLWILRQLFEFAAMGCGIGTVLAIPLSAIQLARNDSSFSIALIFPLLGLAGGFVLALRSIPSLEKVVQHIDRRTGNDDLLATAWSFKQSSDPWHDAIAAIANAHCNHLRPGALITPQIGKRGWSFITLAACVLAALTAMSMIGTENKSFASPKSSPEMDSRWTHWTSDAAQAAHADSAAATRLPAPVMEAKAESSTDRAQSAGSPPQTPAVSALSVVSQHSTLISADSTGTGIGHTPQAQLPVPAWTTERDRVSYHPEANENHMSPDPSLLRDSQILAASQISPRYRALTQQFFAPAPGP